jgi:DUF1365 family protein
VSASCIYEGTIRHRRFAVRQRQFSHRIALTYIDLDELPTLLGGLLVAARPGLIRFRREDYLGPNEVPLADAVRERVWELTGRRPSGPVRVLAHPRALGHCFNPVSFYYCLDPGRSRIEAVLAEVTNTPWGERRSYVIAGHNHSGGVLDGEFDKQLHVSPFMGMGYRYAARLTAPAQTLSVHIESRDGDRVDFDATLALRRRELTRGSARGMLASYPLATIRVLALIYAHALGLRLSGVPVHPHPARGAA